MPLILTLVPIEWSCEAGQREAIAYSVWGLPAHKKTVITLRSGGWRIVRDAVVEFDQGKLYPSAEEAATALKVWIEGGEKPPEDQD